MKTQVKHDSVQESCLFPEGGGFVFRHSDVVSIATLLLRLEASGN